MLRPGAVRLKGHYLGRESDHCLHLPDRVWEVRSQPGSTGTIRWGNLGAASYQGRAAGSAPTYSQAVTGSEGHLFLRTGTGRGERSLEALPSGFSVGIWPEQGGHRQKDFPRWPLFCRFWLRGSSFHLRCWQGHQAPPATRPGGGEERKKPRPALQLPALLPPPPALSTRPFRLVQASQPRGGLGRRASPC